MYLLIISGYLSHSSPSVSSVIIAHFSVPVYPSYSYLRLISLQSFANNSSCSVNVSLFVISFEFSKIAFLYRKFGDYGYLAMYACHCFFICFSVSEQQKNSRTSRTQGYSYPVILNVRLFGNSFRFRGSVQSSVIHFLFVLNVLNLRLPLRSERSISFTYPHFGHLISMFPVVIVTLSKIRHSQRLHLTITFCSSLVKSYTPPDKQQGSQTDYQDNPSCFIRIASAFFEHPKKSESAAYLSYTAG